MGRLSSGQRVGVLAILVIVAIVIGVTGLRAWQASSAPGITVRQLPQSPVPAASAGQPIAAMAADRPATHSRPSAMPATPDTAAVTDLVVHVVGAVLRPGVYHLPGGARCEDALHAAGGPTVQANTDAINLAARLEDGTQLYIPTRKEHPEDHALTVAPVTLPSASATASGATPSTPKSRNGKQSTTGRRGGGKSDKLTSPGQGQIDLNTASAAELQRIPGIGPSMADRLIAYRQQNNGFHSIEDLLQVSGIGEKKFEKMKYYVKTGFEIEAVDKKETGH